MAFLAPVGVALVASVEMVLAAWVEVLVASVEKGRKPCCGLQLFFSPLQIPFPSSFQTDSVTLNKVYPDRGFPVNTTGHGGVPLYPPDRHAVQLQVALHAPTAATPPRRRGAPITEYSGDHRAPADGRGGTRAARAPGAGREPDSGPGDANPGDGERGQHGPAIGNRGA